MNFVFVHFSVRFSTILIEFIIQWTNTIFIVISHIFTHTVRPLTVDILDTPSQLVAERRYEIKCESSGSRPNAIITWYKGKRQLRRTRVCITNVLIGFYNNQSLSLCNKLRCERFNSVTNETDWNKFAEGKKIVKVSISSN